MGQRSNVFIRYEYEGKKHLIARYFQWNFEERMISRLRYTAEWLKTNADYFPHIVKPAKLVRILETNFDYIDVVNSLNLIKERIEYNDESYTVEENKEFFFEQDTDDGVLFIDIQGKEKPVIKYAFINPDEPNTIMSAVQYLVWDSSYITFEEWKIKADEEVKLFTLNNLSYIGINIFLMSDKELEDFTNYDYSEDFS